MPNPLKFQPPVRGTWENGASKLVVHKPLEDILSRLLTQAMPYIIRHSLVVLGSLMLLKVSVDSHESLSHKAMRMNLHSTRTTPT